MRNPKRCIAISLILILLAQIVPFSYANTTDDEIPSNAIHIADENDLRTKLIGGSDSEGKYFVLDNDISLKEEWIPVDDFRGTFDGQGHTVNNLYVSESSNRQSAGLFGEIIDPDPEPIPVFTKNKYVYVPIIWYDDVPDVVLDNINFPTTVAGSYRFASLESINENNEGNPITFYENKPVVYNRNTILTFGASAWRIWGNPTEWLDFTRSGTFVDLNEIDSWNGNSNLDGNLLVIDYMATARELKFRYYEVIGDVGDGKIIRETTVTATWSSAHNSNANATVNYKYEQQVFYGMISRSSYNDNTNTYTVYKLNLPFEGAVYLYEGVRTKLLGSTDEMFRTVKAEGSGTFDFETARKQSLYEIAEMMWESVYDFDKFDGDITCDSGNISNIEYSSETGSFSTDEKNYCLTPDSTVFIKFNDRKMYRYTGETLPSFEAEVKENTNVHIQTFKNINGVETKYIEVVLLELDCAPMQPEDSNIETEEIERKSVTIKNVGVNVGEQGIFASDFSGGLIGYCDYDSVTIENCYVTGSIHASGANNTAYAGGLIGLCVGTRDITIKNCYTSGEVHAFYAAGGLIGEPRGFVKIQTCYSASNVYAPNAGGVIGGNDNWIGTGSNYAGVSTQNIKGEAINELGGSLTEKELELLPGWDFENVWGFIDGTNNGYPILRSFEYTYFPVSGVTLDKTEMNLAKRDMKFNTNNYVYVPDWNDYVPISVWDKVNFPTTSSGSYSFASLCGTDHRTNMPMPLYETRPVIYNRETALTFGSNATRVPGWDTTNPIDLFDFTRNVDTVVDISEIDDWYGGNSNLEGNLLVADYRASARELKVSYYEVIGFSSDAKRIRETVVTATWSNTPNASATVYYKYEQQTFYGTISRTSSSDNASYAVNKLNLPYEGTVYLYEGNITKLIGSTNEMFRTVKAEGSGTFDFSSALNKEASLYEIADMLWKSAGDISEFDGDVTYDSSSALTVKYNSNTNKISFDSSNYYVLPNSTVFIKFNDGAMYSYSGSNLDSFNAAVKADTNIHFRTLKDDEDQDTKLIDVIVMELDYFPLRPIYRNVINSETLTATVSPYNASNKAVIWSSSNPDVATVNDGVVTAVSAGTATITAETVDSGYTAECMVTVEVLQVGGGGVDDIDDLIEKLEKKTKEIFITGDMDLTKEVNISEDSVVIIDEGVTVTISGKLTIAGKIIVEKGASLIVDGELIYDGGTLDIKGNIEINTDVTVKGRLIIGK